MEKVPFFRIFNFEPTWRRRDTSPLAETQFSGFIRWARRSETFLIRRQRAQSIQKATKLKFFSTW
jgi:hypothetical protein